MNSYKIEFRARENGAIGILGNYVEYVEASDEEEAIIKLYDSYEHIREPLVTKIKN